MFIDDKKLYCAAARRGLTITELVQKSGIAFKTLYRIKKGWRSTTKTIGKLCRTLECDPAEIVRDEIGA